MTTSDKGSKPGLITTTTEAKASRHSGEVSVPSPTTTESIIDEKTSSVDLSSDDNHHNHGVTPTHLEPLRPTNTRKSLHRTFSRRSEKEIQAEVASAAEKPWHTEVLSRSATQNDIKRESTNNNDDEDYPEGGLQAWLVVLGSFLGMFACFGFMNTIGVFQSHISSNQLSTYSESTIGWIFSLYVFLSFFGGLQIGPVFDRHGPRLLILAGAVLLTLGTALASISTEYWHFILTIGVLAGLGTSLIFTPAVGSVGHFFLRKRGSATGLAAAGGSVGGIIFPLMLNDLFPKIGYGWAVRVMALILGVCSFASVLLVRSRLPPTVGGSILPDFKIFRQPAFLLTTSSVYFMEWGLFVPITYLSSFLISTRALPEDSNLPFQIYAVLNAGSSLGRYLPGIFADKIGRFNSLIIMLFFCMITTLALWLPAAVLPGMEHQSTIKGLVIAYALIFGFASGSNISLTPVCVGQLCKTEEYGRYYATCYCIVSLGTLTGIPIAGALIKACGGGYLGVVLFTGGCYLCSTASIIGARWTKVGFAKVKY